MLHVQRPQACIFVLFAPALSQGVADVNGVAVV